MDVLAVEISACHSELSLVGRVSNWLFDRKQEASVLLSKGALQHWKATCSNFSPGSILQDSLWFWGKVQNAEGQRNQHA